MSMWLQLNELVVHVTYHETIDMSLDHVLSPLRKIPKSHPQPPFQQDVVWGPVTKPGNDQQRSSPGLQKVCARGQREEFK